MSEYLHWNATTSSAFALVLVSFERFIGIVFPLHYHQYVTQRRLRIAIFFQWFMSFLVNSHLCIFTHFDEISLSCTFEIRMGVHLCYSLIDFFMILLFPVSALIFMYSKMFWSLKDHTGKTRCFKNSVNVTGIQRAKRNVLMNLFIVTVVFISLVTPCEIITFMIFISKLNSYNLFVNSRSLNWLLINMAYYMVCLNSVVNPFVYSFRYKTFRKGIASTFSVIQRTK